VPLRQLKDLVAQKRDYIIIRESYASFFIPACCARAASGHAAAALPRAASNSRRPMVTVIRPSRARCVKGTIPRHEGAVFTLKEG